MAQKLFFAEWPWWLWGMLALASACVGLWMSWMRARQVSAEEMLTEETIVSIEEQKTKRHKALLDFLSRNMSWFYLIVAFGMIWVLVPLIKGLTK